MNKGIQKQVQTGAANFFSKLNKPGYKLQHNVLWSVCGTTVRSSVIWNENKKMSYHFNYTTTHLDKLKADGYL